jgi:hypothetical protein
MACGPEERLGPDLEVLDAHPVVGGQDAGRHDPHQAVVAGVVIGQDLGQPGVVVLPGGLPRLLVTEPGIRLGHLDQPAEDEVQLDRHGFLAPERPVVVEHGDPLVGRHLVCGPLDEVDDGLTGGPVAPARQRAVDSDGPGKRDEFGAHRADARKASRPADHPGGRGLRRGVAAPR